MCHLSPQHCTLSGEGLQVQSVVFQPGDETKCNVGLGNLRVVRSTHKIKLLDPISGKIVDKINEY